VALVPGGAPVVPEARQALAHQAGALEDFLREGERPAKLFRRMDSSLRVPDNVLAIARDEDLLRRIDAAFFRAGEARGGLLW